MFIRNSAKVFIYFSSSHTRLLFEVGAFSIKCSKTLYFLKEHRGAIAFGFKEGKVIRGGAHSIKCNRVLCFFRKRPSALIFALIFTSLFFQVNVYFMFSSARPP